MTSNWETTLLGDLCTLTKGKSPTLKTAPGQYPLIVTGPVPLSSSEYQFEGEAVCIPMVSSTGHGHASLKRVHYARGKFAVANIITACEVNDPQRCEPKFLAIYLQHFKDELIVTRMQGTANVSVSQRALSTIPISLPSLAEQSRIVDLIGGLDDSIEAAEVNAGSSGQSSKALRNDLFESLTVEYQSAKAGTFFDITLGRQKSARQLHGDHEIPYLRAANISHGELLLDDVQTMNFEPKEQLQYCLRSGDVLVVEGGSIGQTALWQSDIAGSVGFDKHVIRLRGIESFSSAEYALQWAKWCYESGQFAAQARGVTIKALGLQRAKNMLVPDLPLNKQLGIVKLLEVVDDVHRAATAHAVSLRKLRRELLTSLLSGVHTIPDSYDEVMTVAKEPSALSVAV